MWSGFIVVQLGRQGASCLASNNWAAILFDELGGPNDESRLALSLPELGLVVGLWFDWGDIVDELELDRHKGWAPAVNII